MPRQVKYDPLSCIPNASAVRTWLAEANEKARRLAVLLRTAEEIEAGGEQQISDASAKEASNASRP